MDELSPIGTPILQVEALDADSGENGKVAYAIVDVLPDAPMFKINPDTGGLLFN